MDGKTVIKKLKHLGWEHVSTHGSHFKLKKPGCLPIVVPIHGNKDLKPGTLRSIERTAGVRLK